MNGWNVNTLRKLRKSYMDAYEDIPPEELLKTEEIIGCLGSMIDDCSTIKKLINLFYIRKVDFRKVIEDDFKHLDLYNVYTPYLLEFAKLTSNCDSESPKIHHLITDKENIINLANYFYKNVGGYLSKEYTSICNDFNKILRISKNHSMDYGQTYSIPHTNHIFIDVSKKNRIQDYITLIHESSHAISCLLNPGTLYDDNRTPFLEIDSLFTELVFNDIFKDIFSDDILFSAELFTFRNYVIRSRYLYEKIGAYNSLDLDQLNNKKNYLRYLKSNSAFNNLDFKYLLYADLSESFNYLTSYLIALELYYIYKNDKEKALNMLKKIVMLKKENVVEYHDEIINMGIKLNEHVPDYIGELEEKGKKLTYEKKLFHR